jgi:hypothetical protein
MIAELEGVFIKEHIMKKITFRRLLSCMAIGVSLMAGSSAVVAQNVPKSTYMSEPTRWTQPDVTRDQKYNTARKEAVNSQQQFLDECKSGPAAQYATCTAEVRMNYQNEMAEINKRFGMVKPMM